MILKTLCAPLLLAKLVGRGAFITGVAAGAAGGIMAGGAVAGAAGVVGVCALRRAVQARCARHR